MDRIDDPLERIFFYPIFQQVRMGVKLRLRKRSSDPVSTALSKKGILKGQRNT